MSDAVSEMLTGMAHMFREVYGEDLTKISSTKEEFYLRNLVRVSMLEIAGALATDGQVIPTPRRKRAKS